MRHRYIVWEGRYRGRRSTEMHIIDKDDKPICKTRQPSQIEDERIWIGRPDRYPLCRACTRALPAFEEAEKLRTWKELAS